MSTWHMNEKVIIASLEGRREERYRPWKVQKSKKRRWRSRDRLRYVTVPISEEVVACAVLG